MPRDKFIVVVPSRSLGTSPQYFGPYLKFKSAEADAKAMHGWVELLNPINKYQIGFGQEVRDG
jgi:hypothetical protein